MSTSPSGACGRRGTPWPRRRLSSTRHRGVPCRSGYQGRYHRPRCETRSHDRGGGPVLGAPCPWGRTGDVQQSLAHSHDTSSMDRDRDGRPSRCKTGRIVTPHLWAFEAKQRRSPTAIRVRATLAVSDRLPVYLFPWIYVRRSLYAVPRHRAGHRDRRTAIPVHITQSTVPVDLQQNALVGCQPTFAGLTMRWTLEQARLRPSRCRQTLPWPPLALDRATARRSLCKTAEPKPAQPDRGQWIGLLGRGAAPVELGETGEVAVEGDQVTSMLECDRRELCVGDEIP